MGRFIAGDPLRGFACLVIVLFHGAFGAVLVTTGVQDTYVFDESFGPAAPAIRVMDVAIWCFFALSAYLLSKPFVAALADGAPMPSTGRYVRSRLLRILPAFWVVYAVTLLRHGAQGSSPLEVAEVFLFVQVYDPSAAASMIGQAWTLNVEMAFYLSLPVGFGIALLVARRLSSRNARIGLVFVFALLVAVASLWFRGPVIEDLVRTRSFPAMLFSLMPGVMLAAVEVWLAGRAGGSRWWRRAGWAGIAACVALLSWYAFMDPTLERNRALVGVLATSALVGGLLALQWSTGGCPRVLHNRVGTWLGERSYSVYLWHFLVQLEVLRLVGAEHGPVGTWLLMAFPGLAVTLVLADLSYRYVELPFLRLKHRRPAPAPVDAAIGVRAAA